MKAMLAAPALVGNRGGCTLPPPDFSYVFSSPGLVRVSTAPIYRPYIFKS